MKKLLVTILSLSVMSGCTTIQYNGAKTTTEIVDKPEIGVLSTAYIGDEILKKGKAVTENVLVIKKPIKTIKHKIPAGEYRQMGFDNKNRFYESTGVIKGLLADPVGSMAIMADKPGKLCVLTVMGYSTCYNEPYEEKTRTSFGEDSFQQTLIYNGRVGNKVKVGYREFNDNMARSAFSNEAEYDLSSSKIIGYKGAQIEVIDADNSKITYKVLRSFR